MGKISSIVCISGLAVLGVLGCGGDAGMPIASGTGGAAGTGGARGTAMDPRLTGAWVSPTNGGAFAFNFAADNTYVFQALVITSSSPATNSGTADVQAETGHFTVSGSAISFFPEKWTCVAVDPAYLFHYSFAGQNLAIAGTTTITTFAPNNGATTVTVTLTLGCFDAAGAFTVHPLAAVAN